MNELFATNTADWKPVGGGSVSVSAADDSEITSATSMYAEVSPTNDAGNGILNTWVGSVLDDYKYTSNSGPQALAFGDLVRVADDHYTPNFDGAGARRRHDDRVPGDG